MHMKCIVPGKQNMHAQRIQQTRNNNQTFTTPQFREDTRLPIQNVVTVVVVIMPLLLVSQDPYFSYSYSNYGLYQCSDVLVGRQGLTIV